MLEKFSSFEKVVGSRSDISEKDKVLVLGAMEARFADQNFPELLKAEREKTPEEIKIIKLTNAATNELRRQAGLPDFNIPPQNFHIIKRGAWPDENYNPFFDPKTQAVLMRETEAESKLTLAETSFHEMVHFKSFGALRIKKENSKLKTVKMRSGFLIQKEPEKIASKETDYEKNF